MRSLLFRIFLSFWLIIVVTIGTAGVAGFLYAESMRDAIETFEVGDSMLGASAALESGGREGLKDWIEGNSTSRAITIFILDDRGHDILDRQVPFGLMRVFRRFREHRGSHRFDDRNPAQFAAFASAPATGRRGRQRIHVFCISVPRLAF